MGTTQTRQGGPVTTVLTWQVRPGREQEFEEWTREITRCARQFPGNQGVSWLRPEDGHRYHAPSTGDWPLPLRAAVFPVVLLPVLTYAVMPLLSRLLRLWLYLPPER